MTNILEAIFNITNNQNFDIKTIHSGRNRMNGMGTALFLKQQNRVINN